MAAAAQQVMLADKWEDQDPTGWWISEKLDGVRAYWTGHKFYSRLGNEFFAPKWFTQGLPDFPLDGELWCGHRQFRKCVSIVKRHDESDDWKYITYFVFDAPEVDGNFEKRMGVVNEAITPTKTPNAAAVGMRRCNGKDHLLAQLKIVEDAGGEGLMLRKPGSPYVRSRTNLLLKVKNFVDEEAIVIAHEKGKGRNSHRMGALTCRTPDGREFSVGSGFNDKERDHPPKIGSVITYKYQELTETSNKPRFPTFVGVRLDIDWKDYCKTYKSPVDDLAVVPKLKKDHSLLFNTYGEVLNKFKVPAPPGSTTTPSTTTPPPSTSTTTPPSASSTSASTSTSTSTSSSSSSDDGSNKRKRGNNKKRIEKDDSGSDTDVDDDPDDDRPPCKFGASCYRKNKAHLDEFYHPKVKGPSATSTTTTTSSATISTPSTTTKAAADDDDDDAILHPAKKLKDDTSKSAVPFKAPMLLRMNSANMDDDDDDLMAATVASTTTTTTTVAAATDVSTPTTTTTTTAAAVVVAATTTTTATTTKKLPACRFGSKCYRKNADHFKDFSHNTSPDDDDD